MSVRSPHAPNVYRIGFGPGLRMGLTAALVTSVVNVLTLYLVQVFGVSMLMPNPQTGQMEVMLWIFPVIASVPPALAAPPVLSLCLRLAKDRGTMVFRTLSVILLVLSFALPFAMPGVDLATRTALNFMHVVSFAGILGSVRVQK